MTDIIDGKKIAQDLNTRNKSRVEGFRRQYNIIPGLDVILVGSHPASEIYVRNKKKAAEKIGMRCTIHRFDSDVTAEELKKSIDILNEDTQCHGIIVQLPVPDHLSPFIIQNYVATEKDVDGLTTQNMGLRVQHHPSALVPCTPKGVIMLLKTVFDGLCGKSACIIGRSNIVGRPMADLLLQENCTVTMTHGQTENIKATTSQADIIVVAAGHPRLVKADWIKKDAVIIDVGINRDESGLVGDCCPETVKGKARAMTPVPGGVGPMTVACLLDNTIEAAERIHTAQASNK